MYDRKLLRDMAVVVGQYSLIAADPDESVIGILSITVNPSYNSTTQYSDIALIEVNLRENGQF